MIVETKKRYVVSGERKRKIEKAMDSGQGYMLIDECQAVDSSIYVGSPLGLPYEHDTLFGRLKWRICEKISISNEIHKCHQQSFLLLCEIFCQNFIEFIYPGLIHPKISYLFILSILWIFIYDDVCRGG